jgi:hypothetical protein
MGHPGWCTLHVTMTSWISILPRMKTDEGMAEIFQSSHATWLSQSMYYTSKSKVWDPEIEIEVDVVRRRNGLSWLLVSHLRQLLWRPVQIILIMKCMKLNNTLFWLFCNDFGGSIQGDQQVTFSVFYGRLLNSKRSSIKYFSWPVFTAGLVAFYFWNAFVWN